jgi:ADP-heptose:LPS heptosyltransferase
VALYDFSLRHSAGPQRILALQLGHLGDFIIGLPALRALRKCHPNALIRLVVGSWNKDAAMQSGLVDEVVTYDFFPEVARAWNGEPAQGTDVFRAATTGCYDVALDLRVDEDTRHLLALVEAGLRCGIGSATRHPYLDIVLPHNTASNHADGTSWPTKLLLGPEKFRSLMPVQTAFHHETDFSVSNRHLIYGPFMRLPAGRFRATFGLRISSPAIWLSRVQIELDASIGGKTILAARKLPASRIGHHPGDTLQLDFTNPEDQSGIEFRVRAQGRPLLGRLAFHGVRLDELSPVAPTLGAADLHIGELATLLVQLVAERTLPLYPTADAPETASPKSLPRVVIAPFSNSDLRDWPADHYARLISLLTGRLDCTVHLIGSKPQREAVQQIALASGAGDRVTNLAGTTAWRDIPAFLQAADLVICNNSGVAHLAASRGVRTLAIYAASHLPQEWGPRGSQARALMSVVPCSPCGLDRLSECSHGHVCMRGLMPELVFDQAARWLRDA